MWIRECGFGGEGKTSAPGENLLEQRREQRASSFNRAKANIRQDKALAWSRFQLQVKEKKGEMKFGKNFLEKENEVNTQQPIANAGPWPDNKIDECPLFLQINQCYLQKGYYISAWRYEIFLRELKKYFTSQRSERVKYF